MTPGLTRTRPDRSYAASAQAPPANRSAPRLQAGLRLSPNARGPPIVNPRAGHFISAPGKT